MCTKTVSVCWKTRSSTNFQGVTIVSSHWCHVCRGYRAPCALYLQLCLVCVVMFLIQGLHHCGACEATSAQHLLQVFQFLLVPAAMSDSVCPVPRALDYSNQHPWTVVRVEVDVMVGVNFLSKHWSTNWGVISLSLVDSNRNPSAHPFSTVSWMVGC